VSSQVLALDQPPSVGRRLLWLWILIVGVLSYLLVLRTLVATQNPNFIPSLLLLGSVVVPASVLAYAASGRRMLVSAGTVALVAVLGGVLAPWRRARWSTTRCTGSVPCR
jgi:protease PrsW